MQARTEHSQRLGRADGFTVAEMVAASLILFVVLMGVLSAVEYAGATSRMASIREGAIDVATTQIEKDRNLDFDDLGVTYGNGWVGDPAGTVAATQTITTSRATYTVSTAIWWARDSSSPAAILPSTKKVRLTVAWTQPTAGSVAIETNVYGKASTGNTGQVLIHAADVDNPSAPLAGINIVMDPYSGTNRIATTGTDGVGFWATVPVGNATFPDPGQFNPNYLVDVSNLGIQTIKAGLQDIGFIYCQRPATARIHVHSSSVSNLANATVTLKDTDRNITYTAVTGADGYATFSASAGTVNGTAGLWKSKGGGYTAVAKLGSATSNTGTFSMAASGQNYVSPLGSAMDLAMADPPSITISKKASTSGLAVTGKPWSVTLKDPTGAVVTNGTYSGTADSFTVPISVAGNYTAIVTGVPGFQDNAGFVFTATATGVNQACVVPLFPYFTFGVQFGTNGPGYVGAKVTLKNSLGVAATSTAGVTPGVTGTGGQVSFGVPKDDTYSLSVVINNVTYTPPSVVLDAENPPTAVTTYTIPASTLNVQVTVPTTTGWWRYVAVYDSNGALVATGTVTNGTSTGQIKTVSVTLPGGTYFAVAGGGTSHAVPPATQPASGSTVWTCTSGSPWWPTPVPTYTLPSTSSGSANTIAISPQS